MSLQTKGPDGSSRFSGKSSAVCLRGLSKVFPSPDGGDFTAVDQIDLTVEDGEMVTLLGPSGCGKTTTLRMISWLLAPRAKRQRQGGTSIFRRHQHELTNERA